MSLPMKCPECGLQFPSRNIVIRDSSEINIGENLEPCPRCGTTAKSMPGTYDFVGTVVSAFRAPGITREKVERFRYIAEQVETGKLSTQEASNEIQQLGAALAALWKWTNQNGQALSVLISIIALYIACNGMFGSDAAADKQLQATEAQTEAIRSSERVQQKIVEELQRQTKAAAETAPGSEPITKKQLQAPPQTTDAPMNRQQRRRAEQLARKRSR